MNLRKKYNWTNFYISTAASWSLCESQDRIPDYVSFSGSAYWNLGNRVVRWSDHWGYKISSCRWLFEHKVIEGQMRFGVCYYEDFNPNF